MKFNMLTGKGTSVGVHSLQPVLKSHTHTLKMQQAKLTYVNITDLCIKLVESSLAWCQFFFHWHSMSINTSYV